MGHSWNRLRAYVMQAHSCKGVVTSLWQQLHILQENLKGFQTVPVGVLPGMPSYLEVKTPNKLKVP
uniref:Uncharacterized protein n=1 Tax=Leersia perrieri TaxID=77586 RepID=A0A0D9VHJ1_9ORYZ